LPSEFADAFASASSRLGRLGSRILYFPIVSSTNDIAAIVALQPHGEGAVIDAEDRVVTS